jgi:hypothetical protein
MGGFIVTIPIRLLLYINYTARIVSSPHSSPCPTTAVFATVFAAVLEDLWSSSVCIHIVSPHCVQQKYMRTTDNLTAHQQEFNTNINPMEYCETTQDNQLQERWS